MKRPLNPRTSTPGLRDAPTEVELQHGRQLFYEATRGPEPLRLAQQYFAQLGASPSVLAYRAVLEGMNAQHQLWPLQQLQAVQRAQPVLDRLARQHPDDWEVRFLRAAFCYALPRMLGRYADAVREIKAIVRALPQMREHYSPEALRGICQYLLTETQCLSPVERTQVSEMARSLQV